MSLERNKQIIRQYYEDILSKGDIGLVDELIAPDYVAHHSGYPGYADRDAFKEVLRMHRGAMPDMQVSVADLIAEGDRVVARFTTRGTHLGHFQGTAPTGGKVEATGIGIHRIRGGQVVEEWFEEDMATMLEQLGAGAVRVQR